MFPVRRTILAELNLEEGHAPVFPGLEFESGWSRLEYVELGADEVYQPVPEKRGEDGFLVLEGSVVLRAGGLEGRSEGPGVILGPAGMEQTLVNIGREKVRFLHVQVELGKAGGTVGVRVDSVDAGKLSWRPAIHGGVGRMGTRHIWGPDDFASAWTFLDHAVLEAGGSVGCHYHDGLEECFLILEGEGYMTIGEETFSVKRGSVTFQGIGEGHGIYNPGPEELDFLRIAVAVEGEEYTTIDLHDDLSGRRPG